MVGGEKDVGDIDGQREAGNSSIEELEVAIVLNILLEDVTTDPIWLRLRCSVED